MLPFPFSDFFNFSNYAFRRPFYERQGYSVKATDNGVLVLFNALGVKKDDVTIEVKPTGRNYQIISVRGKTHDDDFDSDFSAEIDFYVEKKIKKIDWDAIDGFVKIWVTFEEPVPLLDVEINKK